MTSLLSGSTSYVSKEDEKREFDELSQTEKDLILHDMYGMRQNAPLAGNLANRSFGSTIYETTRNNNDHNNIHDENYMEEIGDSNSDTNDDTNDDDISDELLETFHNFLELMPPEKSGIALRAWAFHEELFDNECDPARFLRCEHYDPEKAATRMCEYWEKRYNIFGEDHAFKTMTLNGALNHIIPSMMNVRTFCQLLPDDDYGRTVICFDRTNIIFKDHDDDTILKLIWYIFHEALQRRSTQENGVVLININQSSSFDFPSRRLIKLATATGSSCIPVRICCVHACTSSFVAAYLIPIFKFFYSRDARLRHQTHTSCIYKKNHKKLLQELECFGVHRNNLPKSIGGSYTKRPKWVGRCKRLLLEKDKLRCHENRP